MSSIRIEVLASHNLVVPGVGHLVGEVDYCLGFPGSWDQPPEPAEVENIDLRLASGDALTGEQLEALFNGEESLSAIEKTVGEIYYAMDAEWAKQESERLMEHEIFMPDVLTIE